MKVITNTPEWCTAMDKEVWKAEMDVAHAEEMRFMALLGKSAYTDKFVKQAKRDMKPYEIYEDLFKQIIPESPLKEAFRKWNETTKKIKKGK